MKKLVTIVGTGVLLALFSVFYIWTWAYKDTDGVAMPKDVDIVAGKALYAETCAACHGVVLEGEENWRVPGEDGLLPAPPHDASGHTWHHGDKLLFDYTKLGGSAVLAAQNVEFNSGMPGFGDQLTDQEIWNILAYIKSTWPEEIQEMQAMRTEGETRSREN